MIQRIANRVRAWATMLDAQIKRTHPLQQIGTAEGYELVHLGTGYGGWTFVNDPALQGATIVSAGLGEDASFDVEFVRRYGARSVIVDPTPRAVAHHAAIMGRIGQPRTTDYVGGGDQPVDSYDLSGVSAEQLTLDQRALWNAETTVRFFRPRNPSNVSHSILNYQHAYRDDTDHIEVPAVPLSRILSDHGIAADGLPLLKLDIEGAEVEVIERMLDDGIRPRQLCVEYDEFNVATRRAFARIDRAHGRLTDAGYRCIHTDGKADFLYIDTRVFG